MKQYSNSKVVQLQWLSRPIISNNNQSISNRIVHAILLYLSNKKKILLQIYPNAQSKLTDFSQMSKQWKPRLTKKKKVNTTIEQIMAIQQQMRKNSKDKINQVSLANRIYSSKYNKNEQEQEELQNEMEQQGSYFDYILHYYKCLEQQTQKEFNLQEQDGQEQDDQQQNQEQDNYEQDNYEQDNYEQDNNQDKEYDYRELYI